MRLSTRGQWRYTWQFKSPPLNTGFFFWGKGKNWAVMCVYWALMSVSAPSLCGEPARRSPSKANITRSPAWETKGGKWAFQGKSVEQAGISQECTPRLPHPISRLGAVASLFKGFLSVDSPRHYCNNKHGLVTIIAIATCSSGPKIYALLMTFAL